MKSIYVSGPMRTYPRFNFDLFFQVQYKLESTGHWNVFNPAQMDLDIGFDPDIDVPDQAFFEAAMRRDFDAIMRCDAMVMLLGWEFSTGATAEMWIAKWKHIPIYLWPHVPDQI